MPFSEIHSTEEYTNILVVLVYFLMQKYSLKILSQTKVSNGIFESRKLENMQNGYFINSIVCRQVTNLCNTIG